MPTTYNAQIWPIQDLLCDPGLLIHDLAPQVAVLLYLRWVDFQEAEREAIAAFDESEFQPILPTALHWRSWYALRPDDLKDLLAHRLPATFRNLGNTRQDPKATQLHRLVEVLERFDRWKSQSIALLVKWLADQPFETPSDRQRMLVIFDDLLAMIMDQGGKSPSIIISPPWISTLVAAIARPAAGNRIYDPCFGSAGFLVACCQQVQAQVTDNFRRSAAPALSISGIEINSTSFVIGLARLALTGVDDPQLEQGNSLERTATNNPTREGFDLVVANPPFGMRVDRFGADHFPIKTTDATGLFIQHALAQLRPDGRAVIVVPQGILCRGGADQRLRELLIQQYNVEIVIGLPAGAFMPFTAVIADILIIGRKGPTERVRMVNAERLFAETKRGKPPSDEQIQAFAAMVTSTTTSEQAWFLSAEEIAAAEYDLTPKRRDQSGLEQILDNLRPQMPVLRLEDCCEILLGRSIKSTDLVDVPPRSLIEPKEVQITLFEDGKPPSNPTIFDVDAIPYIRIGDIRKGEATKGTKWLGFEAASTADPRWKLKAGDVLVSKSGTIGKTGVVRNGAVGAVAANGLFILRPKGDQLDPHYLNAYLADAECQAWLQTHARGSIMNHLSKQALAELPIPLPPIQVQLHIAEQHRVQEGYVLSYLLQLGINKQQDPIIAWMDQALQYLKSDRSGRPYDIAPLLDTQVFGNTFSRTRRKNSNEEKQQSLAGWILALEIFVVPALRDCDTVPPGSALFSLLQQAQRGLQQAIDAITGNLPHANRARDLTQLVSKRVHSAMDHLLEGIDLQITSKKTSLQRDSMAEVEICINNRGAMPIRDLHVVMEPWLQNGQLGFLAEGQSRSFPVTLQTPREGTQFTSTVQWTATRMDGRPCSGSCELAFSLVESNAPVKSIEEEFAPSPYVCGDPITPKRNDVFVGRNDKLDQIRRQIASTGNVVLLEGNRRAGKTSILKHLEGVGGVPGWLGVYTSLQGAEGSKAGVGVPTDEIFRTLAREIAKSVHALGGETPLPNGSTLAAGSKPLTVVKACREGISTDAPFTDFQAYIEVILDVMNERNLGLLLMLDEFDKLQEGIDHGVTSPQVPENIRFLVQSYPRFSAILTGSRRLQRMREEYWSALYGLGTRIGVTALDADAAERLITQPVKGRLTYTSEAIRRVIELTAGQPYLLQCLCNRIYDLAAQLRAPSITLDQVERASLALIEDNEHFASLWDYAGGHDHPQRRRYLLCLCHREGNSPDPLRLGMVQEHLLNDGIEANDEDVIADLNHLRELELIDMVGDSTSAHYKISIPLMGIWIDRQRDIDATLAAARAESEDHDA